jgi:hypothetical protein
MTIRRRFWVAFVGVMLVVLSFPLLSLLSASQAARPLRVLVYRQPPGTQQNTVALNRPQELWVQVIDADGKLVENADLQTVANMTTMDMGEMHFTAQRVGQGLYQVSLSFSMPGSWWVRLQAQAPQYQQASQQLTFWVQDIQQILTHP